MTGVGSRKLKNRFGAYLARVKRGESILVTDRGKPVAKLGPPDPEGQPGLTLEDRLKELAAQGLIRLAPQRFDPLDFKPKRFKGKPLSRIILEDRE